MTINDLRSGMAVKRYHTVPRIQEETVGHHSANVCAIILQLNPDCSKELLVRALMHDVTEFVTGDVPATCKWKHPRVKSVLDGVEQYEILNRDIHNPELTASELELLKLADTLDLILSCMEEELMGNTRAAEVAKRGIDHMFKMPIFKQYENEIELMMESIHEGE